MQVIEAGNGQPTPGSVHAAACLPSNDLLSKPLESPLNELTGAIVGILPYIVIGMCVLTVFVGIIMIATDHAPRWLKKAPIPPLVVIGLILVIAIFWAVWNGINTSGLCP